MKIFKLNDNDTGEITSGNAECQLILDKILFNLTFLLCFLVVYFCQSILEGSK
jgi:hypothetical protein